jgi:hypothetical protein
MTVEKTLVGFRFIQTKRGDTMQRLAARELGDASLWTSLVDLNRLQDPYLTDDPSQVTAYVRLTGSFLVAPAPSMQVNTRTDASLIFGTDMLLQTGLLSDDGNGDFALVTGVPNLVQALCDALKTAKKEILFHLSYGGGLKKYLGRKGTPALITLAEKIVQECLEADDRVQSVVQVQVSLQGNAMPVYAVVQPIVGSTISFNTVIGL